jgi:hypothetical protein
MKTKMRYKDLHINRYLIFIIFTLFTLVLFACTPYSEPVESSIPTDPIDPTTPVETQIPDENTKLYRTDVRSDVSQVVLDELELGFLFFWELANDNRESNGYGLIPDRFNTFTGNPGSVSSIASVGYGLSALPIGIENNWVTRQEAEERAYYTLVTFQNMQRTHGFWYHFVNMSTGLREWNSEVSIIDSAIFINGALTVGRYFGGRVQQLAYQLYEEIEWNWYFDPVNNMFYMGYRPESGFEGYWDHYGEQLMVYVLAAGSPNYKVGKGAFQFMKFASTLTSSTDNYDSFYLTWTGSLFTYQYSHAWVDFQSYVDWQGYSWFDNSVNAVDAAIAYAKTRTDYIGIHEHSWGMSASDGPGGYVGPYGSAPSAGNAHVVDGTVPAYGAIGSIVFRPQQAIAAMENYRTYERFWSVYGFKGAYNLDYSSNGWFANDIIGIDKGISILMIENYMSQMIWKIYMEVPYVIDGLEALDFTQIDT